MTPTALASTAIFTLLLGVAAGCGDNLLPAELAGESTHFRLLVDTSLALPASVTPDDVLAGLEANFADVRTMLGMPEGRPKIDYYWLTDEHIATACGIHPGGACQYGEHGGSVLVRNYFPHEHELIHAYASLLFTPHRPPLVLAEGLAEAIGCLNGPSTTPSVTQDSWQDVVTARRGAPVDVYGAGLLLVRYLIVNHGIESFLRYYSSAPRTDDPQLFADHFLAFWSRSLPEVWTAMQTPSVPPGPRWVRPICPCSRAPLSLSGTSSVLERTLVDQYWTLPNLENDTLAMEDADGVSWSDCRQDLVNYNSRHLLFSRVRSGRYFMTARRPRMSRGPYVSDTCDEAAASPPYDLPPDLMSSLHDASNVSVAFDGADPATVSQQTVYLHWRPATRVRISPRNNPVPTVAACTTCDFDAPECQPILPEKLLEAGTAYHIKVSIRTTAARPTTADLDVLTPRD